ncbi:MAG: ABC transporter ATP-binding protein [Clostridia bacterium]|nr:ABC transporter ATP-binding protein [Clostridia bacterium]
MIEVKNLNHSFGEKQVLENINITLPERTVMGLVGINGAGKSTLLRLISAVYEPQSGEILIDGIKNTNEEARKALFFLPDDPYYTIYTTGNKMFELYKVFFPSMDKKLFCHYLETFKLDGKKPIRNFSKGMRRQLYIALALSASPKYILLDEAFDGLDPLSRLAFKRAINTAVEEGGASVLISSHALRELEDFCDAYVLIDNKTVASSGDLAEKVNRYCKFQLAFTELPEGTPFAEMPTLSVEQTGRFVRIVLEGDAAEMKEALLKLHPAVIEEMPMDFEELFIHEVNERGYMK